MSEEGGRALSLSCVSCAHGPQLAELCLLAVLPRVQRGVGEQALSRLISNCRLAAGQRSVTRSLCDGSQNMPARRRWASLVSVPAEVWVTCFSWF